MEQRCTGLREEYSWTFVHGVLLVLRPPRDQYLRYLDIESLGAHYILQNNPVYTAFGFRLISTMKRIQAKLLLDKLLHLSYTF